MLGNQESRIRATVVEEDGSDWRIPKARRAKSALVNCLMLLSLAIGYFDICGSIGCEGRTYDVLVNAEESSCAAHRRAFEHAVARD